jgi:hypothetical protein
MNGNQLGMRGVFGAEWATDYATKREFDKYEAEIQAEIKTAQANAARDKKRSETRVELQDEFDRVAGIKIYVNEDGDRLWSAQFGNLTTGQVLKLAKLWNDNWI